MIGSVGHGATDPSLVVGRVAYFDRSLGKQYLDPGGVEVSEDDVRKIAAAQDAVYSTMSRVEATLKNTPLPEFEDWFNLETEEEKSGDYSGALVA